GRQAGGHLVGLADYAHVPLGVKIGFHFGRAVAVHVDMNAGTNRRNLPAARPDEAGRGAAAGGSVSLPHLPGPPATLPVDVNAKWQHQPGK
nr:hypothetical protein [Tanacetum cinerariifolium]